jgi:hypothetical protein
MMSIGLRDMKLHSKVVDRQQFKIRKLSGGPATILHTDGRNVDVGLGELRYGERKEMLIELELGNTGATAEVVRQPGSKRRTLNATDQFNQRMGLDLSASSPRVFICFSLSVLITFIFSRCRSVLVCPITSSRAAPVLTLTRFVLPLPHRSPRFLSMLLLDSISHELAMHLYDYRMLQSSFEHLLEEQMRPLLDELHKYTVNLMYRLYS